MNTRSPTASAAQWIGIMVLFTLSEADYLTCLCNQVSNCVRTNSTWGVCTLQGGQGLCIASWERSLTDNSTIMRHFCLDSSDGTYGLLVYSCLPTGATFSGTPQYPIVNACCQSNNCNTPDYLQSFVSKLLPGSTAAYVGASPQTTPPALNDSTSNLPPQVTATPSNLPQITATPSNLPQITATPSNLPQIMATPSSLPQIMATPSSLPQVTATPSSLPQVTDTPSNLITFSTDLATEVPGTSPDLDPTVTTLQATPTNVFLQPTPIIYTTVDRLTCLCNQFTVSGCVQVNSTWGKCSTVKGVGLCVVRWEKLLNTNITNLQHGCDEGNDILSYRCLPLGYYRTGASQVTACCQGNYCNTPEYIQSVLSKLFPDTTTMGQATPTFSNGPLEVLPSYVIPLMAALSVIIVMVMGILVTFLVVSLCPRLLPSARKTADLDSSHSPPKPHPSTVDNGSCGEHSCDLTEDSGSGSGLPLLSQQSIAAQVVLQDVVGKGRFGEVWRGTYKGDSVAVKIFHTREETSWNHEVDIYQTCLMRHPNVLRFIASDNKDMGMQVQLWLISEFCEHGSLYEFLQLRTLDEASMLRLCYTAVCGLNHLHSEIVGREGKPAIAHRDLKSRNILVKADMVCCIADLGLGLRYNRASDSVEELSCKRVGTRRYLAPEVITETIGTKNFESFKRADMYSLGLVLWEVARRGVCGGIAEDAQLPFFDSLPLDPTIDDMQRVVVMEKKRPGIPNRWSQSELFSSLSGIMQECWAEASEARMTALRVKKSLANLQAAMASTKGVKDIEADNVGRKGGL